MKIRGAVVALTGLAVMAGCSSKTSAPTADSSVASTATAKKFDEASLQELTVAQVDERLAKNDPTFHVYDANNQDVFLQGHVPSAKWVPFSDVKSSMLPENKSDTLVFYCANEH
jgi:PBP1b-binding outer membrane lipoprotein LpoB